MFSNRRGHSLVELTLACTLVLLTLALVHVLIRQGLSVLHKVERQSDLVGEMQIAGSLFRRDAMATSAASLSLSNGEVVSMLSPLQSGQTVEVSSEQSELIWKSFRVYYFDSSQGEICCRQINRTISDVRTPTIEGSDLGFGLQPPVFYCNQGTRLVSHVSSCRFTRERGILSLSMEAQKRTYRGSDRILVSVFAEPRNP